MEKGLGIAAVIFVLNMCFHVWIGVHLGRRKDID